MTSEVDLAYEIFQAEIAQAGARGIAIVRKGQPPTRYFNAFVTLGPDNEFLHVPSGISILGVTSSKNEAALRFLIARENDYDWSEIVAALRARGLHVLHFESWDGP